MHIVAFLQSDPINFMYGELKGTTTPNLATAYIYEDCYVQHFALFICQPSLASTRESHSLSSSTLLFVWKSSSKDMA